MTITVEVDLDEETYDRLSDSAAAERRPVPWHAAVLLRRTLDLPFPYAPKSPHEFHAQVAGAPGKRRAGKAAEVRP